MNRRSSLALPLPPPDRGRLLSAVQVGQLVGRSPGWVKANVPHKLRLGHRTVVWYELDVRQWLEASRAPE